MRKVTPKQYALSLYQAVKESRGEELKVRIDNFLQLVKQRKDVKKLDKIFSSFVEIYHQEQGLVEAELISARPLLHAVKEEILAWLKKYTGREPLVTETVNPEILGGAIVKFSARIADFSLAKQLKDLNEFLID